MHFEFVKHLTFNTKNHISVYIFLFSLYYCYTGGSVSAIVTVHGRAQPSNPNYSYKYKYFNSKQKIHFNSATIVYMVQVLGKIQVYVHILVY